VIQRVADIGHESTDRGLADANRTIAYCGHMASSLFTFDPQSYGLTHPYFVALRGGPNGKPQTITPKTGLTATIWWTDASGKTWERTGSGPADASKVDLSEPVRISA
jgi:hypothetical protein